MDDEKYAEQIKWREGVQEKINTKKNEELEALNNLTFQPTLETKDVEVKKMTGYVAELTVSAGNTYVERQMKARKEKQSKNEKLIWRPTRSSNGGKNKASSPGLSILRDKTMTFPYPPSTGGIPQSPNSGYDMKDSSFGENDIDREENNNSKELTYEETLVEMLEKERKEWHVERVKLIHCIYLQQMELTERAVAAQEKAAEIAKEFGKAIMTFEQRLDTIEGNVEKEIKAVKDIAENLLKAVNTPSPTIQQPSQTLL